MKKRVCCKLTCRESAAVLESISLYEPALPKAKGRNYLVYNALHGINLYLLRIDLKQNLLVWPNIAGDLTARPHHSLLPNHFGIKDIVSGQPRLRVRVSWLANLWSFSQMEPRHHYQNPARCHRQPGSGLRRKVIGSVI